jgi:UDP-N-acetylmuramate dehydrogenase
VKAVRERTPTAGKPLAAYTTLRLGGPAERLVTATTEDEVVAAVADATRAGTPLLVLGGGSNVVVGDNGFAGTVVLVRTRGIEPIDAVHADAVHADETHPERAEGVRLRIAAGHSWDEVCATAVRRGWAGIECLSGIPGSAGATPIQNVGAYGQEVAETITSVRAYDRGTDEVVTISAAQCGFAYRTSVFKYHDRYVLLSVDLALAVSPVSTPIRYAELARVLGVPAGGRAPLPQVREAVLHLRTGRGMVLDAGDPDTYSAGSFFTNPVLSGPAYAMLRERSAGIGEPPAWPGEDATVKVSAAWLIEHAGYPKGYGETGTGVAISGRHTLALTNRGTGTTKALLALAREIRDGVQDRVGVTLVPEPVLVGCEL